MPNHPEVSKSPSLFVALAGAGVAGSLYGGALWVVLWFIRSADIANWNAEYWKCAVTTLAVNALRMYDRKVFSA